MAIQTITDKDKVLVEEYMWVFHRGLSNSATRDKITSQIGIEDRRFRAITAQIDEIFTHATHGYWYASETPSKDEITAIKETLKQEQSRMVALYLRQKRRKRILRMIENKKEPDLFGGV